MKHTYFLFLLLALLLAPVPSARAQEPQPDLTGTVLAEVVDDPTPQATPEATAPLATLTATAPVVVTPIIVATATPMGEATELPTATLVPTATETHLPMPTAADTSTPTVAETGTATPTPTATVTASPTATGTSLPLDEYEPDNVPQAARRLVVGEVQHRTFYSPTGPDTDWVVVYLKPGRWRITAATTTGIYDPRLTLGQLVGDDDGQSKNAVLDVTATVEGEQLVRVENLGLDGAGEYLLTLERLGDLLTPTPTPTLRPGPGSEDSFEPDVPPHSAPYTGPQLRTFNPAGDEDFVRYRLKAGLRIWIETSDLTGGADTEIHVFSDEDGLLQEGDAWLASDDDGGERLGSRVSVQSDTDRWLTILVRNKAAAWGPSTGYTLRIISALEATPTATPRPAPTTPPVAEKAPTYTPYPTQTALPTQTPLPTYTPLPTAPPPLVPPGFQGSPGSPSLSQVSHTQSAPPAQSDAAPANAPQAPIPVPSVLRLTVFTDVNRDGLMNFGEEAEGVLVYAQTRTRSWEAEAYLTAGEALLPLAGLPAGEEVVVLLPYLHRSGQMTLKTGTAESEVSLNLPVFPVYLP